MARVILFSHLAQVLGVRELEIDADSVAAACAVLATRFGPPLTQQLSGLVALLNNRPIDLQRDAACPLGPADELVLLPPAAGG